MDVGGLAQGGVITLFLAAIGWLFWKRGSNEVKNTNASADRQSTLEENLQDRLEMAVARADSLEIKLRDSLDGRALDARRLKEAKRVNTILLEMLEKDKRESAERWVQASTFAPLDELPKPRKG